MRISDWSSDVCSSDLLEAEALRIELAEWAASIAGLAEMAQPAMPDCIADRNADVWGPLFAAADLAGGTWQEAVRMAATDAVLSDRPPRTAVPIHQIGRANVCTPVSNAPLV